MANKNLSLAYLDEAQEHLEEAINLIRKATVGTTEQKRAEAYILPHLQSWIDGEYQVATIQRLRNDLSDPGNYY